MMTHLPHINRYLTTFPNHTGGVIPHHPLFKVREHFWSPNPAEGFGCLMSNHIRLLRIPQDLDKGWN